MPDFEIVPGQHRCPYCGDMYWVDNVILDSPPPQYQEVAFNLPCYHQQLIEYPGDMNFCSICGNRMSGSVGGTLRQWQLRLLERLGV